MLQYHFIQTQYYNIKNLILEDQFYSFIFIILNLNLKNIFII